MMRKKSRRILVQEMNLESIIVKYNIMYILGI